MLDRLACDIANQGEEGDTELAHINSYEAKLLRSVGGSGTINKTTGLKQYKGGGGGSPAPAATSTVVEKAEFPPELRPYITDILEKLKLKKLLDYQQVIQYTLVHVSPSLLLKKEQLKQV